MIGLGLEPPAFGIPNAVFAANGHVFLGPLTIAGTYPYVVFSGNEIFLNQDVNLPSASDILVQWRPPSESQSVGIFDSSASLGVDPVDCGDQVCDVFLFNLDGFDRFPGTTHAIGSGAQTGPIEIQEPIDIGSQNIIFAGQSILGLANITTTGVVGAMVVEPVLVGAPIEVEETIFLLPHDRDGRKHFCNSQGRG